MMEATRNDQAKRIDALLRELHLPAVRESWEDTARRAARESLSYESHLLELAERESESRRTNRIERLLREPRLPLEKNHATLDLKRFSRGLVQQYNSLRDGSFLDRRENVLAFGKPGAGKSHLICAIGNQLVQNGRRAIFTTCGLLVQDLLLAKRELRLARAIKRLSKYEAVIIDDIGYVQQSREEMEVLFTLLAERYERGSVMITSNLPFSKWEAIFKDPMTTAAAIDRLVHHSVILEINVTSYRVEQAKHKKQKEE
jgi:DNA replication protein DnaC